jgi:hypothetical protein
VQNAIRGRKAMHPFDIFYKSEKNEKIFQKMLDKNEER